MDPFVGLGFWGFGFRDDSQGDSLVLSFGVFGGLGFRVLGVLGV